MVKLQEIGKIGEMGRGPFKSMGGREKLKIAEFTFSGHRGNKVWAAILPGKLRDINCLTIRELPEMARYKAYFINPEHPNNSPVRINITDPKKEFVLPDEHEHLAKFLVDRWEIQPNTKPVPVVVSYRKQGWYDGPHTVSAAFTSATSIVG